MGNIVSRFRAKKSTKQLLEAIEKNIGDIEEFQRSTQQAQKKIVIRFLIGSVALYVGACIIYYYWFPPTLELRLLYALPLMIIPFLIMLFKRIVTYYYSRKITGNQMKLLTLRTKKKRYLDEVMEKETFKVAKEILEKYAPEQLRRSGSITPTKSSVPSDRPRTPIFSPPGEMELRRRTVHTAVSQTGPLTSPRYLITTPLLKAPLPPRCHNGQTSPRMITPMDAQQRQMIISQPGHFVRPILPQHRTLLDRFVQYIVGDGPNNRYALICINCFSHNGMALKEEFEYLGFRCCYCAYLNPARKQRLSPPLLPTLNITEVTEDQDDSSSTSPEQDDDDDDASSEDESASVSQSTSVSAPVQSLSIEEIVNDQIPPRSIEEPDAISDEIPASALSSIREKTDPIQDMDKKSI